MGAGNILAVAASQLSIAACEPTSLDPIPDGSPMSENLQMNVNGMSNRPILSNLNPSSCCVQQETMELFQASFLRSTDLGIPRAVSKQAAVIYYDWAMASALFPVWRMMGQSTVYATAICDASMGRARACWNMLPLVDKTQRK